MAAVTLANLMDPLKKIEAATQETSEKLDALIAVSIIEFLKKIKKR